MHIFGLTGGIASGKGVVASRFRARGLPVVDADQLAREVVMPGTDGYSSVVLEFGPGVLLASGELDRKALGRLVFADSARKAWLERLLHPLIRSALVSHAGRYGQQGHALVCYEAPLLVETGMHGLFRPLVVVTADEAVQLERVVRRDGMTREDAVARISSQLPLAEKVRVADFVVDNSGASFGPAVEQADAVLASVCERLGVPLGRYPIP